MMTSKKLPFIKKTPTQQRNLSLQVARKLIKSVKGTGIGADKDKTNGILKPSVGLPSMVQHTIKQILRSGNMTVANSNHNDDKWNNNKIVQNILPPSIVYPARLQKMITVHRRTNKFGVSRETRINQRNFLAGPQGVDKTGPPLELDKELKFPSEIRAAFGISIRSLRWQGMRARLGPWAKHVQVWGGTNGELINKRQWQAKGKLQYNAQLGKGQIGCYDSHVRLWQHIVQKEIPVTLIMEDDANLRYISKHAQTMETAFKDLTVHCPKWDLLYLGRGTKANKGKWGGILEKPKTCSGLFAYCLTLEGAKKLLRHVNPYTVPIDVLVARLHDNGVIVAASIVPSMIYVVPVRSDTAFIH